MRFRREAILFALAALMLLLSARFPTETGRLWALSAAGSLIVLALLFLLLRGYAPLRRLWLRTRLGALCEEEPECCICTDETGTVLYRNRAARLRGGEPGQSMADLLPGHFADPSGGVARMLEETAALGAARRNIVAREGTLRLCVHRVEAGGFLWRLEEPGEVPDGGGRDLPRMTLSSQGGVLETNGALRRLLGERIHSLDGLAADPPLRLGEEQEIVAPGGAVRCFVYGTEAPEGRRAVYFLPVAGGGASGYDAAAFEVLPVALMRLSAGGAVEAVNRAGRVLLGEVQVGTPLSDLLEGLGRPVADWVADACSGRTERRPEVLRLRGHDREAFLQVTLGRMVDQGRVGLIAVLSDATQLKRLEAQFTQSQKMQAIGQLAGGVAHDFNNLLTAISGHCDLLMMRHDSSDADFGDLDQIRQNANRAAALVRQLLAFSRKQTMNLEVLDLRDTLSDLTHLLNRLVGEKMMLSLIHDPELKPVRADRRQIEQVLVNLVLNARDAMPGGGEIRIETCNLPLAEDLRRDRATVPKGEYVEVSVGDSGTGIAPDLLPKIFEPFFTTKRTGKGTGLGLSTVYGIVKQTGGYVFCDSEPGQGSRFSILLPVYDRGAEEMREVSAVFHAPGSPTSAAVNATLPATVLLVEDEAAVRAFASRALKLRGYSVFEAENGEQALHLLDDPDLRFDIFVSDVIMPGMDGPTWVSRALEKRPLTAVIFMSGYAEDVFHDGLPPVPNSVFLPKPFSLNELTALVQRTLGR